jgi:hypothetical protein
MSCGREPRGSLTLRLHGAAGRRTVLHRRTSPDRTGRLITEPVLRAGVGGGRTFVADPEAIEIIEPSGRSEVDRLPRPSPAESSSSATPDEATRRQIYAGSVVAVASDRRQQSISMPRRGTASCCRGQSGM